MSRARSISYSCPYIDDVRDTLALIYDHLDPELDRGDAVRFGNMLAEATDNLETIRQINSDLRDSLEDSEGEVEVLRKQVYELEDRVAELENEIEDKVEALEREIEYMKEHMEVA